VYVLEANPRASRTVPLVSKVCGLSMARLATRLMLGAKLSDLGLKQTRISHYGVKEAVFPFNMYPEVDPVLGPEMRSTGEVLGMASSFGLAFFKAQEAVQPPLPIEGTVLISVADKDDQVVQVGAEFVRLGFKIMATNGTHRYLAEHGVPSERVNKLTEGRPHIVDEIMNRKIQLVINTPIGRRSQIDDSYIRKTAIRYKIPYVTTLAAALASVKGIAASRSGRGSVRSLQSYHADIKPKKETP
jgi:carbamoyl-phosphate synthase large subunit